MIGMFYLQVMTLPDSSLHCDYDDVPHQLDLHQYENEASEYEMKPSFKSKLTPLKNRKTSVIMDFTASSTGTYSCDFCSYVNNHKQNFKSHMMTHTGEKPYACSVCTYRGTQKNHLDNHMKTHTGEKSFVCQYCDYKTAWKGNLKVHLLKHSAPQITPKDIGSLF